MGQIELSTYLNALPRDIGRDGTVVLFANATNHVNVVSEIKAAGFNFLVDLCAVDYLDFLDRYLPERVTPERFEVVTNFLSHGLRARLRLRTLVSELNPVLQSISLLYPGAENMEREAYDMFGIVFDGHPDLSRILMPDDWEGHPLRKDYSVGRVPVQFKEAPYPK